MEERHDRAVRRRLQREAVALLALVLGALLRGFERALGETGEALLLGVVDEQLERRGSVDDVLRELERELGERDVDVAEALLSLGPELGAVAAEVRERLREVTAAGRVELGGLLRGVEIAECLVERLGEEDLAVECSYLGTTAAYAARSSGVPSTPSRWLARLLA